MEDFLSCDVNCKLRGGGKRWWMQHDVFNTF